MNPETFFDNFGLLADTPNGVQKLRELILQRAVQGKLVPQDSNDEPAAVLLERIKAEKERLVKEKKIRKSKPLHYVKVSEVPFDIPLNWEWTRIGEIGQIVGGGTPKTNHAEYFAESGIPWLTPADLYRFEEKFISRGKRDISELGLQKSSAQLMPKGTVLFSSRAPIGYVAIADNDLATNQGFKSCVPFFMAMNEYVYYFLKSAGKNIENNASGTTFKEASSKIVSQILFPLPPLNEQKRIVAKVDQLMSLCDELEARQQKKQEARLHLNSAALDRLLTAHEPDEFAHHWQRICDNFDLIYGAPENVGELRKAILQLAVQGKLVPQDPNDEPAAVLLEGIREKKEELVKEGKIKKTKTSLLWDEGEVPYKLPKEWKWTKFCDIATIASNLVQPEFYLDLPHIAPNNIEKQTGKLYQYRTIREDNVRSGNHKFYSGQILYSKIRPNLAKVTIVNFEGLCSADMYPINAHIDSEFLLKYMLSQTFLSMSVKKDTRVAMPKINQSELNNILVPIPPISEQRRIVAKVDQLMAHCDDLESKLKQSQTDGEKLMGAVVAELVDA